MSRDTSPDSDRMGRPIRRRPALVRLMEKVTPEGDCLVFRGSTNHKGYGSVGVGSQRDGTARKSVVHRVVYEVAHGPIPEGMLVMHTCDNPPCVRLDHLRLGTVADNQRDMAIKGRSSRMRGEKSGKCRWSEAQVLDVRKRVLAGESTTAIARATGISQGVVQNIVSGRRRAYDGIPDEWCDLQEQARLARAARAEAMCRDYEAGHSTIMIAERFGTHAGNVSRILRAEGMQMRRPTPTRRDDLEPEILRRLRAGERVRPIADALGISRMPVNRVRRKAGIPPARPGRPYAPAPGRTTAV